MLKDYDSFLQLMSEICCIFAAGNALFMYEQLDFGHSCIVIIVLNCPQLLFQARSFNSKTTVTSQPTTCDHINIKYIWGPHVNHMGTPH